MLINPVITTNPGETADSILAAVGRTPLVEGRSNTGISAPIPPAQKVLKFSSRTHHY
jgi:hypothetical protein